MKQVAVMSGKGGTGKTSVTAALASLARGTVLADCDSGAPDLGLLVGPLRSRRPERPLRVGFEFIVDHEWCIGCGQCTTVCRFGAVAVRNDAGLGKWVAVIDAVSCIGCGCCADVCPVEAIGMRDKLVGSIRVTNTRFGPLVDACLEVGKSGSGRLVAEVRDTAARIAVDDARDLVLIDGAPGIGCPVIAGLSGVDAALLVAEPSESGRHDLGRILEVCVHFSIPSLVVVNKRDIYPELAEQVERECIRDGIRVLPGIPFHQAFHEASMRGVTVMDLPAPDLHRIMREIWVGLQGVVRGG
ncbi:ATP-binding protein [bacterium]|nr:ATP-binding protein [candidate division CSSED10-310 bacterium]